MPRVLHILSQRPSLTGSGVTLDALVRHAAAAGWAQAAVCGVPADDPRPDVGGLPAERVFPLLFGADTLPFPLPGMSDVMPYRSSVWSQMRPEQLDAYRDAWRAHLAEVLARFAPDVIHAHHVWVLSSLLPDVAPGVPAVVHCHATGLRQLELCPQLADEVRRGAARNARFAVLHDGHAEALAAALGVAPARIDVVGAGYRDDLFHARGRAPAVGRAPRLLYVGKYSAAKGLPQLLDALERVRARRPAVQLHVAGGGDSAEADALRARMDTMADAVVQHGQLGQADLAALARRCDVCVLPSFYEGIPLVLVEALACGCRLVATALPGVDGTLAPHLGAALARVALPPMAGIDTPRADGLPAFVERLADAVEVALDAGPIDRLDPAALAPFGWGAVFARVQRIWDELLAG